MANLTEIIKTIYSLGRLFGLDRNADIVFNGHRIYFHHDNGPYGAGSGEKVLDLDTLVAGGGGPSGPSGSGAGLSLPYAPAAGTVDPGASGAIASFVAGLGATSTGRLLVTLAGNTTFEGLPPGVDGQQLYITVVAGNYLLTLSHLNGATAGAEILFSMDMEFRLGDSALLVYNAGSINQWCLVA